MAQLARDGTIGQFRFHIHGADDKAAAEATTGEGESNPIKRYLYMICGLHDPNAKERAEEKVSEERHMSLRENPTWQKFWNVMAIAMMTVAVFMYTFYG